MEKCSINIDIEVEDIIEFERVLVNLLENNVSVSDYELEFKKIYTKEEERAMKGLISKAIKKSNCLDTTK